MRLFSLAHRATASQAPTSEVDPHQWNCEWSPKDAQRPSSNAVVTIPRPAIFLVGAQAHPSMRYTSVSHCAAHLVLVECFQNLLRSARQLSISANCPPDYDRNPAHTHRKSLDVDADESFASDLLLRLAISRFHCWWLNISRVLTHSKAYSTQNDHHLGLIQLSKDYLPPLDVLLVWYAFMLDNDAYMAACASRHDVSHSLDMLAYPLMAILEAVDLDKMTFQLPQSAAILFHTLSGQSADILTYLKTPPAYTETNPGLLKCSLLSVTKMQKSFFQNSSYLLWIRSPALFGTLLRASEAYLNTGDGAAEPSSPAHFGLVLVARTDRLYPRAYNRFRRDSPAAAQIGASKAMLSQVDDVCLCWICERIRNKLPSYTHALRSSSELESDNGLSILRPADICRIQEDVGYYSAVEKARKNGLPLPIRDPTTEELELDRTAATECQNGSSQPESSKAKFNSTETYSRRQVTAEICAEGLRKYEIFGPWVGVVERTALNLALAASLASGSKSQNKSKR
ncbi:hypothetical protein NLG97_g2637 [Lecanicillium saksenae]|uniref:Uncharacterized protein n=1 Tax=Lecanicillium saksenae TaxID=468837 RepID=A0ACC1R1L2_9HYPO|nr:hypothetical protein NLG97_g2637 [Lecanicillium saksenae]